MQHYSHLIVDESYFSFQDVYRRMVQRFGSGSTFVEVGVLHGQSLAFLGVEIVNSGKQIRLFGVDNFKWHDGQFRVCSENLRKPEFDGFLSLVNSDSAEAARLFADNSLQLVFIDSDHSYEGVKRDIEAWLPKVQRGNGVLAGHDYNKDWFPGCVQAVDEAFGDRVKFSDWTVWEVEV